MLPVKFYTPGIILYTPASVSKNPSGGLSSSLFSPCPWNAPVAPYTCRYFVHPLSNPAARQARGCLFLTFPLWLINAGYGGDYSLGIRGWALKAWFNRLFRCAERNFSKQNVRWTQYFLNRYTHAAIKLQILIKICFHVLFGQKCGSN